MKSTVVILSLTALLSFGATAAERTPVLIELFTSQGCSSCPPADAEFSTLLQDQPLEGIEVIGISQHVDYWNSLGWKDPFSKAQFSERQRDYARKLNTGVYTPQLVIDGRTELVGSRRADVRRAIRSAAAAPKLPLMISLQQINAQRIELSIALAPDAVRPKRGQFWYALVEDRLQVAVESGENRGRGLSHDAVSRLLRKLPKGAETAELEIAPRWRRAQLRVIAFLVDGDSGQVLAVKTARLE